MTVHQCTVRGAEYNSAETDIQGGQSNCPEKEENKSGIISREKRHSQAEYNSAEKDIVKRDNIPRKCQERKLAQGCTRKEQRKSARSNLAGFCKSPKMGTKFAYLRFFLYLCSGKEKNGQVGGGQR